MSCFKRKRRNTQGARITDKEYTVEFRDHLNVIRRIGAFSDKSASRQLEEKIKRLVAVRMAGGDPDSTLLQFLDVCPKSISERLVEWQVVDTARVIGGKRIDEMIKAWEKNLRARESSDKHVQQTTANVKRLFGGCGFIFCSEINAEKVENWLAECRKISKVGSRTSNSYLISAKAFCNWLIDAGYIARNPLAKIAKLNEKADKRRERQSISDDRFNRLLAAAESGKAVHGMTGPDRALLYLTAIETGLRWSELRSLTRRSFDFSNDPATVTVLAKDAKNGLEEILPLRLFLTEKLKSRMMLFAPEAKAFPGMWKGKGAKMLRIDLEAAKIPDKNQFGEIIDFHALRHSFITGLAQGGVHPKIAQDLARHSTIELTLDRYTHTKLESRVEALGRLPDFRPEEPRKPIAKTGTSDIEEKIEAENLDRPMDRSMCRNMQSIATKCNKSENIIELDIGKENASIPKINPQNTRGYEGEKTGGQYWARTSDPLLVRQVL